MNQSHVFKARAPLKARIWCYFYQRRNARLGRFVIRLRPSLKDEFAAMESLINRIAKNMSDLHKELRGSPD